MALEWTETNFVASTREHADEKKPPVVVRLWMIVGLSGMAWAGVVHIARALF